jgi:hypothetical protein
MPVARRVVVGGGRGILKAASEADERAEVERAQREGERAAPGGEGGGEAREAGGGGHGRGSWRGG